MPYPVPGNSGFQNIIIPKPPSTPDEEKEEEEEEKPKSKPLSPSEILDFTKPEAAKSLTKKVSPTTGIIIIIIINFIYYIIYITNLLVVLSGVQLTPDQIIKAQKYCKWAASALTYDDMTTARTNLEKALHLINTGEEM